MNIRLEIEGSREQLKDVFAVLGGQVAAGVATVTVIEPTKPTEAEPEVDEKAAAEAAAAEASKAAKAKAEADKATKAAKAAADKAAKEAKAAEEKAEAEASSDEKPIKVEELRAMAKAYTDEQGVEATRAILSKYGAPSVSKLDPKHFAAVKAMFEGGAGIEDINEDDLPY